MFVSQMASEGLRHPRSHIWKYQWCQALLKERGCLRLEHLMNYVTFAAPNQHSLDYIVMLGFFFVCVLKAGEPIIVTPV